MAKAQRSDQDLLETLSGNTECVSEVVSQSKQMKTATQTDESAGLEGFLVPF